MFIKTDFYGTRSSTLLLIKKQKEQPASEPVILSSPPKKKGKRRTIHHPKAIRRYSFQVDFFHKEFIALKTFNNEECADMRVSDTTTGMIDNITINNKDNKNHQKCKMISWKMAWKHQSVIKLNKDSLID